MAEYEAYKDSGAVWIGKIPAAWTVTRLKNHLRRIDARNPGGVQVLSLYRELGIVPKDSRDDNHNVTSEDTSNYKYVQPGDFVVNKMKAWQGSVAVSDYEGIVSPAYYVYKFLDDRFHKRYFHYLIRSCYKEEFMSLSAGIRIGQWDLASQDLDNVPVLIPTMTEQVKIAEYLDRETERIGAIIAEAKASVEEYKAWKESIIYEAVTKGLDPNVEMKDSGIEWIGETPKHWTKRRLKDYYKFEKGKNAALYTKDYIGLNGGDYPVYSGQTENNGVMGCVDSYDYDIGECLFTTTVGAKVMTPKILHGRFSLSQNCLIMLPYNVCDNVFFYYALFPLFSYAKSLIPSYMQPSLRIEDLNKYSIFAPDIDEQKRISAYLDDMCSRIDNIITEKQALISDLEVYKKSLIFEVVTGKRKVV